MQSVATGIIDQVHAEYREEYSLDEVKAATHRHYETKRRVFNDSQPKRQAQVKRNRDANQRRGFRKRLYERRLKVIKGEVEKKYWTQINYEYMTEESEDEENDRVRTHKLPWTSTSLNKLKHKLDARLKAKDMKSGRFTALERIESTSSLLPPPKIPVKWAVSLTDTSSDVVVVESSGSEQFSSTGVSSETSPPEISTSEMSTVSDDNFVNMSTSPSIDSTPYSLHSADHDSTSYVGNTPNRYEGAKSFSTNVEVTTNRCHSVGAHIQSTNFDASIPNRPLSMLNDSSTEVLSGHFGTPTAKVKLAATSMPQNRNPISVAETLSDISTSEESSSDWSGPKD